MPNYQLRTRRPELYGELLRDRSRRRRAARRRPSHDSACEAGII